MYTYFLILVTIQIHFVVLITSTLGVTYPDSLFLLDAGALGKALYAIVHQLAL